MSPLFIAAAVVAQFLYVPSALVGVVAGLCTPVWRRIWWVAAIATAVDVQLMFLPFGDGRMEVFQKNWMFLLGTVYPAALVHVAIGSWVRQRFSRPRQQQIKSWPGPRTRR